MTSKPNAPFPLTRQKLFQWCMLCTIILCLGGGIALLVENQHMGAGATGASLAMPSYGDVAVSGPPTLSAATVDRIFARLGSPMLGTGKAVEVAARQNNIDDAFAMAVWWTESNDGAAGVGLADRNPGSVRGSVGYPSAFDGYTIYPAYTAAIAYWFGLLRNGYVNRGIGTVYAIARPYVGTTSYPLWAGKVIALMWSYRGIAPPPPPVVTPRPKPTISPAMLAITKAKQQKLTALLQSLADNNTSPLPSTQGLTQEIPPPITITTTVPENSTATPPTFVQFAVICLALLLSLIVMLLALFTFKLPAVPLVLPQRKDTEALSSATIPSAYAPVPVVAAPIVNELTPSTEDLPPLPIPMLTPLFINVHSLPAVAQPSPQRVTEALPRRVRLLPTNADIRTLVPAATTTSEPARHSQGLLSLYGQRE